MPNKIESLQTQITAAVRQAAAELRSRDSELFGFALCIDDDVRTLYHIACNQDWVRENAVDDPDIGFIYVEWALAASDAPFDAISKQLADLADETCANDAAWAEARDQRFQLLVAALRECRAAGVFSPETLLCAGSTDPSAHLEALAMSCVDAVNTADVADKFARALGYESQRGFRVGAGADAGGGGRRVRP